MEEFEQSAFLLHSRPYRENQILLEFLTSQQGKISAISYLGKSLKSNKKSNTPTFLTLKNSVERTSESQVFKTC